MKKLLLPLTIIAVLASVLLYFFWPADSDAPAKRKGDGPANPGWEKQYFALKKNEQGVIPYDLIQQLRQEQLQAREERLRNRRPQGNLLNVVEVGPDNVGGRTRAFMTDITDENYLMAGGVSGGIWRSVNKGQSWMPVDDFAATLSVTDISQNPFNPNIIYYSTGEALGNSAGTTGNGVFKSVDKGLTFTQLPSTANNHAFNVTHRIKCSLTQPNTVFVASDIDGLYRSEDGGLTFSNVFSMGARAINDIEVFADGSVMIGVFLEGIYRSPTGDPGTFVKLTNGLPPSGIARVEIAYCDSVPDVIYAALGSALVPGIHNLYKTTNGGLNWAPTTNPAPFISFRLIWYALALAVKPDDPDMVMLGSVGLGFSADGGTTWQAPYGPGPDQHVIKFNPFNSDQIYVGNDAGLHRYNYGTIATEIEHINSGYNVTQFYAGAYSPVDDRIIGGAQDNGILFNYTGTSSFSRISAGDGGYAHVHHQNPDIAYASTQYGDMVRTQNMQSLWPNFLTNIVNQLDINNDGLIDDGSMFISPFEINPLNGDQLYFPTNSKLWRSNNQGNYWIRITGHLTFSSETRLSAIGVSAQIDPTVYLGSLDGKIFRVANAGGPAPSTTTLPSSITGSVSCITVHSLFDSVVYISSGSYSTQSRIFKIHESTSANPVWTDISGNLPVGLPVNWVEVSQESDKVIVAATDMGIYTTTDGGINWVQELEIPNVPVFMLRLRKSDNKLHIFTHGRGIWTATMPNEPVSSPKPVMAEGYRVYPNPASGKINVKGACDRIEFFNSAGWKVYEVLQPLNSNIAISSLPAGAYTLRLYYKNKMVSTQRFVKQ